MIKWIKNLIADRKYKKSVKNYKLSLEGIFELNNKEGRNKLLRERWEELRLKQDTDEMKKLIEMYHAQCDSKNSNCLKEVFCPECPFGLLVVQCYRSGW